MKPCLCLFVGIVNIKIEARDILLAMVDGGGS